MKLLKILIFVLPVTALCQSDVQEQKIGLTTGPMGIVQFMKGPNINLGIDYHITENKMLFMEFGIHRPFLEAIYPQAWNNIEGFYLRPEIRFLTSVIEENNCTLRQYFGIEFMYGKQSYTRTDLITDIPDTPEYELTYDNNRTYGSVMANKWFLWQFKSNIELSCNLGLGVRLNQVKNDLTEEESSHRYLGDWTVPANYIQKKGLSYFPKMNIGFRVGFRI